MEHKKKTPIFFTPIFIGQFIAVVGLACTLASWFIFFGSSRLHNFQDVPAAAGIYAIAAVLAFGISGFFLTQK